MKQKKNYIKTDFIKLRKKLFPKVYKGRFLGGASLWNLFLNLEILFHKISLIIIDNCRKYHRIDNDARFV